MPKKSKLSKTIRYGQELPTPHEIHESKENIADMTSDHRPILVKKSKALPFTFLSFNLLQKNIFSGYAKPGSSQYPETLKAEKERHGRIIKKLINAIKENKPDFIALQEIHNKVKLKESNDLLKDLLTALKNNKLEHYIPKNQNDQEIKLKDDYENLVLWNTKNFQLISNNTKDYIVKDKNVVTYSFESKPKDTLSQDIKRVHLSSAHMPFKINPKNHEKYINNLLRKKYSNHNNTALDEYNVVMGDFNCTVNTKTKGAELKNLTTSVGPNIFRLMNDGKKNYESYNLPQTGYNIDGCYFSSNKGIFQSDILSIGADGKIINTKTEGREIQKKLNPNSDQYKEFHSLRLVMLIDKDQQQEKIIAGKTVFEYEKILREDFNVTATVRPTKSLLNHSGIGIILEEKLYEKVLGFIKKQKFPVKKFQLNAYDEDTKPLYWISVDQKEVDLLVNLLRCVYIESQLATFRESLKKTEEFKTFKETLAEVGNLDNIPTAEIKKVYDFLKKWSSVVKPIYLKKTVRWSILTNIILLAYITNNVLIINHLMSDSNLLFLILDATLLGILIVSLPFTIYKNYKIKSFKSAFKGYRCDIPVQAKGLSSVNQKALKQPNNDGLDGLKNILDSDKKAANINPSEPPHHSTSECLTTNSNKLGK